MKVGKSKKENINKSTHRKHRSTLKKETQRFQPIVLATWDIGMRANNAAWKVLSNGGSALDAVEKGANAIENEFNCCVGLGGIPDKAGHVTLDATIMDDKFNFGSVAYLERIKHPISVARKIMENTPHAMLVGDGALQFAIDNGFPLEDPDNPSLIKMDNNRKPNYHDTLGIIAIDAKGRLSGACTTSGLPHKMHGRVGDSAIVGAGLYVDNAVGAAVATGEGEEIMRINGSSTVVDAMARGMSPEDACKFAVNKMVRAIKAQGRKIKPDLIIGFLAINKSGEWGTYSLHNDLEYAIRTNRINELRPSKHLL